MTPFVDFYSETIWLSHKELLAHHTHARVGGHSQFGLLQASPYAIAGGDATSAQSKYFNFQQNSYVFAGLGLQLAYKFAQVRQEYRFIPDNDENHDWRTYLILNPYWYSDANIWQSGLYWADFYSESVYSSLSEHNIFSSHQLKLGYRVWVPRERMAVDMFPEFFITFDKDGMNYNNRMELRPTVRFQQRFENWGFGVSYSYAYHADIPPVITSKNDNVYGTRDHGFFNRILLTIDGAL